jgi:hypothetical protein
MDARFRGHDKSALQHRSWLKRPENAVELLSQARQQKDSTWHG